VHHVDLVVSSLERSLPFYRELLEPLAIRRWARSKANAA
jgi:catechol 2,3-dioxygenase-like lactoylglutathione lyase family enzyme